MKTGTISRRIGLGLLALAVVHTAATSLLAKPVKITEVEGITEFRLDNGLRVLLFPDQSKETVTVNIVYLVGSRHEGLGEKGMAHLLEHMVFKGTPTNPNVWGILEDHGANFNGTTWTDRTNYYETLPATEGNLEFALKLEADRMVNSKVSQEDLDSEMTVVRNEFEIGENYAPGVLSERIISTAFLWHNYGASTIGNRSDIERVPVKNLRAFYKRFYQPDNAMLVVAGKFEPAEALGMVETHFGAIPKPDRELPNTYTIEPTQDGERHVVLRRVGDVQAAGAVYHMPAAAHRDFPAVKILTDVLTDEPSGPLYKALVEPGLATSVGGYTFGWAEPGMLEVSADARLDQDIDKVLEIMTGTIEGFAEAGITDEEVNRAKTRALKNIKLSLTNSGRIGVRLSEWAAIGDWRMFFIHRDRLKEVTTDDVRRVAKNYLVRSNCTTGVFYPTKEPTRAIIPETPEVEQIVANYKGTETIAKGEAFEATADYIEQRTKRMTLDNGIKVALLPKETRGDAVQARFTFRFGTEEAMTGHTTALGMIPDLMMRGTRKHDYQQLRDEFDKLQARMRVRGGAGGVNGSITTDRNNLPAAIELLGEILLEPAFPPDQFDILVKEELASLEEQRSDPQALGFNALMRATSPYPKGNIRYVPTVDERIEMTKAVSLGSIKDLYSRMYGANNLEVTVVGDFDEKQVAELINKTFGSWKAEAPYKRITNPYTAIKALDETIHTPDKTNAVVVMGVRFPMTDEHPDYAALDFANYIFGQSAKSRLLNKLRHEGGMSYGAGSFMHIDSRDDQAGLMGYAMCSPDNAAKAQKVMYDELQKWIAEGITEEELTAGKEAYRLAFKGRLANDRAVVGMLGSGLEIGRTMEYHKKHVEQIEKLTLDDIKKVLKKHLDGKPVVKIKAGDLEGTTKPQPEADKEGKTVS